MTFSLAARCPRTGQFALAIASSSPAVAARCAHLRAGVGAVASQNITDPRLGAQLLALMAAGASARAAIERIAAETPFIAFRQLSAVDRDGETAAFSGARTLGRHATAAARGAVAAGNLLADAAVPQRMLDAFHAAPDGALGERTLAALQAGLVAGGEAGPVHSAGLLLVDTEDWPLADLRVDFHPTPIAVLADLWRLWQPQMEGYVQRALRPDLAPAYGVVGES